MVLYLEPMPITLRREALVLFIGDIAFLILSLWTTLLVRYAAFPGEDVFMDHLAPFSFLFALSILVFFIAGLYEKHTLMVKSSLPETIFYAQIANIMVGAMFFSLIPYFGIHPKTNLFIYLFFSTVFVSAWRVYLFPVMARGTPVRALLVGGGAECAEIYAEVNGNSRYTFQFVKPCLQGSGGTPVTRERIFAEAATEEVSVVVMPFASVSEGPPLPTWDAFMISGVRFIDSARLYEDLFDRVSLSLLDHRWFLAESAGGRGALYRAAKRVTDIVIAAVALAVLSPLILVVAVVLKASGSAFIFQKRVGKGGRDIAIVKFRSMLFDDGGNPEQQKLNRVTAIGTVLRKTRIDEIPQFWNVLTGELSLIGPRPEIRALAQEYEQHIPFYNARLLIQPGVSGWAQIKHKSPPKFKLNVEATREKLSYDLYYLKHRSVAIDVAIALRTVKILLSLLGR